MDLDRVVRERLREHAFHAPRARLAPRRSPAPRRTPARLRGGSASVTTTRPPWIAEAARALGPRPRVGLAGRRVRIGVVARLVRLHVRLEEHLASDDGRHPRERERGLSRALSRRARRQPSAPELLPRAVRQEAGRSAGPRRADDHERRATGHADLGARPPARRCPPPARSRRGTSSLGAIASAMVPQTLAARPRPHRVKGARIAHHVAFTACSLFAGDDAA